MVTEMRCRCPHSQKNDVYGIFIDELFKRYTEVKRQPNCDRSKTRGLAVRLANKILDYQFLIGDYDKREQLSFTRVHFGSYSECMTISNHTRVVTKNRKKITLKNAFEKFFLLMLKHFSKLI